MEYERIKLINNCLVKLERRRAELESRFEKTEQRRLAHLNNRYKKEQKQKKNNSCSSPKTSVTPTKVSKTPTTSVTNSPTLLISPMSSVTLIEQQQQQGQQQTEIAPKAKKPSSWSIILKAFRDLGLPLPSKPETWLEFNSLGKLLHQAKVIVVTTKVLNTALKLNDEESRQRARVLLTSYMTLMCPKEVLQDVEGVEEKVRAYSVESFCFHVKSLKQFVLYRDYIYLLNKCYNYLKLGLKPMVAQAPQLLV